MEDTKRRTEDDDLDSRYWTNDGIYAEVQEYPEFHGLILFHTNLHDIQAYGVDLGYRGYIEKRGDSVEFVDQKTGEHYPLLCDKVITVEWDKTLLDAVLEIKKQLVKKHPIISRWKAFAGTIKYDQKDQALTLIYGLEPKEAA